MLDNATTDLLSVDHYQRFLSEIEELKKRLEKEEETVESLQTQLKQANNEVEQERKARETFESTCETLHEHKSALVEQTNIHVSEKEGLREDLKIANENAVAMKENLEKELQDIRKKLDQANEEVKKAEKKVFTMDAKRLAAEKKVDDMQLQLSEFGHVVAEAKREATKLESDVSSLELANKNLVLKMKDTEKKVSSDRQFLTGTF